MPDLFGDSTTEIATKVRSAFDSGINLDHKLKVRELISNIKWIGTHVKTEFITELLSFQNHKSVAVRREVVHTLGEIGDQTICDRLEQWRNSEQDRQTLILLNTTIDKLNRQTRGLIKDRNTLQVSEFLTTIRQLIGTQNFTVEGEVAEINAYHQVVYIALKDKNSGERLDCMAFYTVVDRLDFSLNEGLSIRVVGKAGLAKNSSKLRLNVSFIELTGEGEFLRNLKILESKLAKEGLFDASRKRKLATIPRKIVLLVSKDSAAESDFIKVFNERRGGVEICVLPIKTQGDGALKILLNAINQVSQDLLNPFSPIYNADTVVITRGGGSKDDLILFNQEQVVRAIYALPKPSVVAIGHEKDFSLAEMVADFRASTPTQAAMSVSISRAEIGLELNHTFLKIKLWMNQKYDSYRIFTQKEYQLISRLILYKIQKVELALNSFHSFSKNIINLWQHKTTQIYFQIIHLYKQKIHQQFNNILWVDNYALIFKNRLTKYTQEMTTTFNQIHTITKLNTAKLNQDFINLIKDIELYNPKQALARGYAMVTDFESGKIVEKWSSFNQTKLKITLKDGEKIANLE